MYIAGHQYVNCTWHTGCKQHNSVLFHNSKELYLSLYYSYTEMKKLVILVFSCALQLTYGSEPNIDGTIIANAKSPMDRRDPRLFFGVRNKCILSHQTSITFDKVVSEASLFLNSKTFIFQKFKNFTLTLNHQTTLMMSVHLSRV